MTWIMKSFTKLSPSGKEYCLMLRSCCWNYTLFLCESYDILLKELILKSTLRSEINGDQDLWYTLWSWEKFRMKDQVTWGQFLADSMLLHNKKPHMRVPWKLTVARTTPGNDQSWSESGYCNDFRKCSPEMFTFFWKIINISPLINCLYSFTL